MTNSIVIPDGGFSCGIPDSLRCRLQGKLPDEPIRLEITLTAVENPSRTSRHFIQTSHVDWKVLQWQETVRKSGFKTVKRELEALTIDRSTRREIVAYLRERPQRKWRANATFLFYFFLDAAKCDAIVGDLEERHGLIRKRFGSRRADLWYWKEAIRTTGPIAWAWIKKLVVKFVLAMLSVAAAHGLKDGSLMDLLAEWLKRIRS